jgi:hypothetical protein
MFSVVDPGADAPKPSRSGQQALMTSIKGLSFFKLYGKCQWKFQHHVISIDKNFG